MLWVLSDRNQYYSINQKTFKYNTQYLNKKVAAEQIELYSHLNLKLLQKKNNFDFNNDVFDVDNVEVSDSNHQIKKLSFTKQKYQKVKEIS